MFKLLLVSIGTALLACLLLNAALLYFYPLSTILLLQNTGFHLLIFFVLGVLYHFGKSSKDFSSLLLVAIVLRLLACLVYVLVLRLQYASIFFAAALHFMLAFVVFTVVDLRFAMAVIRFNANK